MTSSWYGYTYRQCDLMARSFFNILITISKENWPKTYSFAHVGSKCCQTLNKPYRVWQRLFTLGQNGEISSNLFTLLTERNGNIERYFSFDPLSDNCKQISCLQISSNHRYKIIILILFENF